MYKLLCALCTRPIISLAFMVHTAHLKPCTLCCGYCTVPGRASAKLEVRVGRSEIAEEAAARS